MDRDPVLITDSDGLPPVIQASSLRTFIQRGGVAPARDVAHQDLVALMRKRTGSPRLSRGIRRSAGSCLA